VKENLIIRLRCLACGATDWQTEITEANSAEIREGCLRCRSCGKSYPIRAGIVDFLEEKLAEEIRHEKEHAESFGYIVTSNGEKYSVNRESLQKFRSLFLSLPAGDGSHFFMPGGSFDNQAGNASRFFETLDLLKLRKGERVLEVGASFCWGSRYLAKRGCDVTALDITNYPQAADIFFEEDGIFFDRVMADMSSLPFSDGTFDTIFSHSVIHHCKDLSKLFGEFRRILKPCGRVVALHECAFGLLENKAGKALQQAIDDGFNENAYTLPQWERGARGGGFRKVRFHFFSVVDDYVNRKKLRKAKRTFKIALAEWLLKHALLHKFFHGLTLGPRVLLRPKSWMMIAVK
jgi:SAM-dependent methyltransferase